VEEAGTDGALIPLLISIAANTVFVEEGVFQQMIPSMTSIEAKMTSIGAKMISTVACEVWVAGAWDGKHISYKAKR